MLLIGLTGGLATGKSTVSALLGSEPYKLPIIDADVLARQVVEPGTYGYKRVIGAFGPTTPDLLLDAAQPERSAATDKKREGGDDGGRERGRGRARARAIDRAALGRRVFGSTPSRVRDRKVLNGIIHPLVRLAMVQAILYYYLRGHWAVLLDIPLLYESGLDLFCGVVVMVAVSDAEVQMRRLRERDKALSAREAEERVGSQMAVEEKVGRTKARGRRGKIVVNDGTREDLEAKVRNVMGELKAEGGLAWRRVWLWGSPLAVVFVGLWEVWQSWRARKRWEEEKRRKKE